MPLVKAICTSCGAALEVDNAKENLSKKISEYSEMLRSGKWERKVK